MIYIQGIRKKAGFFLFKRKTHVLSRDKKFVNLTDARSVGIIYHQSDSQSFDAVHNFTKKLTNQGKNVFVIGYIESKIIPDNYLLRKGYNFFCLKDLNWFFSPKSDFIDGFIEKDLDLLINLSIDSLFPIEYIYALSKAKFKVGRYTDGSEYADLLIDIKSRRDINYLIQQMNYYLRIINKKQ